MFQKTVIAKITKYFKFIDFFPTAVLLRDNVGKYGRARQAADEDMIRYMLIAC